MIKVKATIKTFIKSYFYNFHRMLEIIIKIISGIITGIVGIIGFIFHHVLKGIGTLIQQLTIKAGMLLLGLGCITYFASHI